MEATLETLEAALGISQATLDSSQEHVGAKGSLTSGHTKDPGVLNQLTPFWGHLKLVNSILGAFKIR